MLIIILVLNTLFCKISVAENNGSYRVVGGSNANKQSWKFMAVITYGRVFNCGGSLIKTSWVLTAAHCVDPSQTSEKLIELFGEQGVRVGTDDLKFSMADDLRLEETKPLEPLLVSEVHNVQGIAKVFIHAGYKNMEACAIHDIALIKLSKAIELSESINLVALPTHSGLKDKSCAAAGWGNQKYEKHPSGEVGAPNVLQEVNLPIGDKRECAGIITRGKSACRGSMKDKLCTIASGKGVFEGDSGGPFVCGKAIHGISSSVAVTTAAAYNFFTDVTIYMNWINIVLKKNGEEAFEFHEERSAASCKFWMNYFVFLLCLINLL